MVYYIDKKANNEEILTLEEALDKAGFGLYSYLVTALSSLIMTSLVCLSYANAIIIPSSACDLQTNSFQRGILAATPFAGLVAGGTYWGYLADRHGRKNMLMISLLSSVGVNALSSLSVNWIMLMILQFITSVLSAGQYSLCVTIASECVPWKNRSFVVFIVTSIFVISQGMMTLMAMPIVPLTFSYHLPLLNISWNAWRTVTLLNSTPGFFAAIWIYFMYESPKFLLANEKEEDAIEVLRKIRRMNGKSTKSFLAKTVLLPEIGTWKESSNFKEQLMVLFKPPLLKSTVVLSILLLFQTVTPFRMWLPSITNQLVYALETGEHTNRTLCEIISNNPDIIDDTNENLCSLNRTTMISVLSISGAQTLVNLILVLIIGRVNPKTLAIAITTICGFFGVITNLIPNATGSIVSFCIFLMGVGVLGVYTSMSVHAYPTHLRALASSLLLAESRVSIAITVQILQFFLSNYCELGFYLFTLAFASSGFITIFYTHN